MEIIVDGKRYDTDQLEQLLDRQRTQEHSTGITLLGVWRTKDERVLVITDSVWAKSSGSPYTVGATGYFADAADIARLANRYDGPGGSLWEMIPAGE